MLSDINFTKIVIINFTFNIVAPVAAALTNPQSLRLKQSDVDMLAQKWDLSYDRKQNLIDSQFSVDDLRVYKLPVAMKDVVGNHTAAVLLGNFTYLKICKQKKHTIQL